jgi:hypothetical protein
MGCERKAKLSPSMIESLHITGFKAFRELTLQRLGILNLLVGENNTGKSCILEAVSLYAGNSPVGDVIRIAGARAGERSIRTWDPSGIEEEGTAIIHPVFALFNRDGVETTKRIVIGRIDDSTPLRLEWQLQRLVTGDDGMRRYVPTSPGDVTSEGVEMAVEVRRGPKRVGLITRRSLEVRGRLSSVERFVNPDASAVAFLPARGFSDDTAAAMWDTVVQGPGQDLVLDWLRIIDPNIEDLAFIAGNYRSRVGLIKVRGAGRVPLSSMGDGITRMFHLALAVASASKGVLLVDEFENGLHWSVQDQLWRSVASAAKEFRVQVFCTTHSRDCVGAFTRAATPAGVLDAAIYRLERDSGDVFPVELPLLNVDAAVRQHAEIR